MDEIFLPRRRFGMLLHGGLLLLSLAMVFLSIFWMTRLPFGNLYVLSLLAALIAFLPVPFLAYRLYALYRAAYLLGRDRLVIHWGLRQEEIPIADVEWLRPASDVTPPLRLPRWALPGSVLGVRRHPDLGRVEFLAAERDPQRLLLIGTARRVFVISPEDLPAFVRSFARMMEMGALSSPQPISVYPSFLIGEAWRSPGVRFLWSSGFLLNLLLLLWVLLLIPTRATIALGFDPQGFPYPPVPSTQWILLPLESLALGITSWLAGLYLYRWPPYRALALLLWGGVPFMAVLYLLAVYFATLL
ncbi:MAG: PH domain-containing protein [Anaerolineales bacterium]